jgi:nuclear GTP-binding protein
MGKSSSKRLTVREKNKNKKKQAERVKKAKKAAKRGAHAGGRGKKGKADPGIPALHPLKEKLLAQLERRRNEYVSDLAEQKDLRAAAQRDASISLMAGRAVESGMAHEDRDEREAVREHKLFTTSEGSRSAFYKEFEKVVEEADVILQVLDARDPLGSRSPVLETEILAKNPDKRIVLILNKVDLVPKDVVSAWLKYLRAELPTIAFKCATTQGAIRRRDAPATLLETGSGDGTLSLSASTVLGGSSLLQLLKNYARSRSAGGSGPSAAISVGIIGFPNVGKSSLINSMKREKTSGTSSTPGSTKRMQSIQLDKQVRLLDCPGIVFAEHADGDQLILQNAVNIDQLAEPTLAVDSLVRRVPKSVLLEQYLITDYDVSNPTEFLTLVAKRRGKLLQVRRNVVDG